jgi:hypothetical protein
MLIDRCKLHHLIKVAHVVDRYQETCAGSFKSIGQALKTGPPVPAVLFLSQRAGFPRAYRTDTRARHIVREPFSACTRMSSSMPGTAETRAAIQTHSSAASAVSVRSAVLPVPRAPSKMPVRFGFPGPFRKASSMLSIALPKPAMTGGTRPDPSVKELMRAAPASLLSANASLISFAILGKLCLLEISGNLASRPRGQRMCRTTLLGKATSGKRISGKWKRWPELGIRHAGNLAVWRKAIMDMGSLGTSCVIRMQAASLLL